MTWIDVSPFPYPAGTIARCRGILPAVPPPTGKSMPQPTGSVARITKRT
ncbi:MAG: hypothetical protein LBF09_01345 [Odoribacteraceae bacterium]|nr:hypothetical protein [Odoribacteraceae bacterium]